MGRASTHTCHAARQQISAQLDGELDQLGRLRLPAHLARCRECRRFQSELKSITVHLRREELEAVPPHRHREWRLYLKLTASAATLAAASVIAITLTDQRSHHSSVLPPSGFQWHADPTAYNHSTRVA